MSNAGIIDLGNSTLIFDTFNTQQAAEDLKVAAEELTGHSVQYVVNSHWHGDHVRGNQAFSSSIIISSTKTFDLISTIFPNRIQQQKEMLPQLDEELVSLKQKMETEEDVTWVRCSLTLGNSGEAFQVKKTCDTAVWQESSSLQILVFPVLH